MLIWGKYEGLKGMYSAFTLFVITMVGLNGCVSNVFIFNITFLQATNSGLH